MFSWDRSRRSLLHWRRNSCWLVSRRNWLSWLESLIPRHWLLVETSNWSWSWLESSPTSRPRRWSRGGFRGCSIKGMCNGIIHCGCHTGFQFLSRFCHHGGRIIPTRSIGDHWSETRTGLIWNMTSQSWSRLGCQVGVGAAGGQHTCISGRIEVRGLADTCLGGVVELVLVGVTSMRWRLGLHVAILTIPSTPSSSSNGGINSPSTFKKWIRGGGGN